MTMQHSRNIIYAGNELFENIATAYYPYLKNNEKIVSIKIPKNGYASLLCTRDDVMFERRITYCETCFTVKNTSYMVQNIIWEKYSMKYSILCLECLQEMISGKLTIDDFPDLPINDSIHFGYKLGREEKQ